MIQQSTDRYRPALQTIFVRDNAASSFLPKQIVSRSNRHLPSKPKIGRPALQPDIVLLCKADADRTRLGQQRGEPDRLCEKHLKKRYGQILCGKRSFPFLHRALHFFLFATENRLERRDRQRYFFRKARKTLPGQPKQDRHKRTATGTRQRPGARNRTTVPAMAVKFLSQDTLLFL